MRLGLALAAGGLIALFHALAAPQCLQRLEGVSEEATRLWLSHVREARPIYRHGTQVTALMLSLPIAGLIGYGLLASARAPYARPDAENAGVALPPLAALVLLFWQTRTGPAAQMMSIPGAVAVAFILAPLANSRIRWLRIPGTVLVVLVGLGALVPFIYTYVPDKPQTAAKKGSALPTANACSPRWRRSRASRAGSSSASSTSARG